MAEPLSQLIDQKGFGALYFDGDLNVIEWNTAAAQLLDMAPSQSTAGQVTDLLPELVGIESRLERIVAKKEALFRLDYINRAGSKDQARYLNLLLLACREKNRALIVIEDTTSEALAVQVNNQQRYDMFLYRASVAHRRDQISRSILGQSAAIERIVDTVHKLSRIPSATVLIMGETGTGKNLTARMIHESAMAAAEPFVEINCAALPEQLIEAELFGYEKGAFTHAVAAKPGLLEEAHGGTLFLNEIGELPLAMQAKLLSVIESKRLRRLGSTQERQVNVRIIAATNRDLLAEVAAKTFRQDLFFRLNVVSMTLPPLRTLGEDIVLIGERFIELLNLQFSKKVRGFSAAARRALLSHPWPGNVRELSNCIERAMIFINGNTIDLNDLALISPAVNSGGAIPNAGPSPPMAWTWKRWSAA